MLESITFLKDYRVFKEGQMFEFKPGINLLVGEQGTGKSSLLKLIAEHKRDILDPKTTGDKSIRTRFFDFESNNPRTKSYIETATDIAIRFVSHGECNNKLLRAISTFDKDVLILMDEPDMALSIRSIHKLYKLLQEMPNQVVCSVHNPLLIELVGEVLSLEHDKWMSSNEFIQLHSLE